MLQTIGLVGAIGVNVGSATATQEQPTLWDYSLGNTHPTVASVNGDTVYAGAENFYALDASDGSEKWIFEESEFVRGRPAFQSQYVFFGSVDEKVYALSKNTGELKWTYETEGHTYSPTAVNSTVYVGSYDSHIYAIDAGTGELNWVSETKGRVSAAPLVFGNVVYVGDKEGFMYALNEETGSQQWIYESKTTRSKSPSISSGATIAHGTLFFNNGELCAVNPETGEKKWRETYTDPHTEGSPTVVGDSVFTTTSSNVIRVNAQSGIKNQTYHVSQIVPETPTIVDGTLYIGGRHEFRALDIETGETVWQTERLGLVNSNKALVADGVLYITTDDTDSGIKAIDVNTNGWSEDSATMQGVVGYHDMWKYNNQGIETPADIQVSIEPNGPVTIGDELRVTVEFQNAGEREEEKDFIVEVIPYDIDCCELIGQTLYTVPPISEQRHMKTFTIDTSDANPGTYRINVKPQEIEDDDQTSDYVELSAPNTPTETNNAEQTSSDSGNGFGVGIALASLGIGAYWKKHSSVKNNK